MWLPTARIMFQCFAGAYQKTFGSRQSASSDFTTGFPSYLVKLFPPSVDQAIDCCW